MLHLMRSHIFFRTTFILDIFPYLQQILLFFTFCKKCYSRMNEVVVQESYTSDFQIFLNKNSQIGPPHFLQNVKNRKICWRYGNMSKMKVVRKKICDLMRCNMLRFCCVCCVFCCFCCFWSNIFRIFGILSLKRKRLEIWKDVQNESYQEKNL